jgi:putative transposase
LPQDREDAFSTQLFARYQRKEKALVLALMEIYVEGVTTRKVKEITEKLSGSLFSKRASSPRWPAPWTPSFRHGGEPAAGG